MFLKNGKLSQDVVVFSIFFVLFMIGLIVSGIFNVLQGEIGFGAGLLIGGAGLLFCVGYVFIKWLIYDHQHRKEIEEASGKDLLTGLMVNNVLRKTLADIIKNKKINIDNENKILCTVIGIDRFKHINQSLGFGVGDNVIKEFANRVSNILGKDDILSRINGDEFAIISIIEEKDVNLKLNILKNILNDKYQIQNEHGEDFTTVTLSVSIGSVYYDENVVDGEDLLKRAQIAMIYSKKQGGGQFSIYTDNMESKNIADLQMENELREAVAKNELIVHYQPKYSSTDGKIVGAEALVRWYDPRKQRLIPPMQFIKVAEDIGIIDEIGRFVLKDACEEVEYWQSFGHNIKISVNLSTKQFKEDNLVDSIKGIVECYNIPHKSIELEVTESLLMDDVERGVTILQELRDLGIRISIDDFGTGYSSLSYLKLIPTNTIKVDRAFVSNIETSDKDVAIVSTIIHLAHSLGCDVVAEGVETEKQFEILKDNKCDYVQGYYFSKPLPKNEFRNKMEK